jgi:hypothetical protein
MKQARYLKALLVAGGLQATGLVACASTPRAAPATAPGIALSASAPADQQPAGEATSAINSPVRVSRQEQQFELPALAANSLDLPGLTMELETVSQVGQGSARRTITRTSTVSHVRPHGGQGEWWFARNPVDGRRVSAIQIDHQHETLIEHSESELRNAGIVRGWADVAYLGVDIATLQSMAATGRQETLSGFQFEEYASSSGKDGSVSSIWWSEAAGAPLRVVDPRRQEQVWLRALRTSVDTSLLEDPRRRFPGYSVIDIADAREKQHEHGSR